MSSQRAGMARHNFDQLPSSRKYVLRPARADQIGSLYDLAATSIAGLSATRQAVARVHGANRASVLAIYRGQEVLGFHALLFLNVRGVESLLLGEMNFGDPDPASLAESGKPIAGVYIWAMHAPGLAVASTGNLAHALREWRVRQASIFARPATAGGSRWLQSTGFARVTCAQTDLWRYARMPTSPVLSLEQNLYELPAPFPKVAWRADADSRFAGGLWIE